MNQQLDTTEVASQQPSGVVAIEQSRSIAETQSMFALAKRFPRDTTQAFSRIMKSCARRGLAEQAKYVYNRGGQTVEGVTIRLMESVAQNWGNLDFGLKIDQREKESYVTAYAIDLETNVRRVMNFTVRHWRDTKQGGYALTDARDIYELASNMGSRRLRKCLEGIIPGDIIESAAEECEKTLKKAAGSEPIEDRIRKMVVKFSEYSVTQEMIEKRIQHKIDATNEQELVTLGKIFVSLKNGASDRTEWFEFDEKKADPAAGGSDASALNAAIKNKREGKSSETQLANDANEPSL